MIYHDDKNGKYITLFIPDYHCEYPLPEHKWFDEFHSSYDARVIFDAYRLEELLGEEGYEEAAKHLPKELTDYGDHFDVWEVYGTYDTIRLLLIEYATDVFRGPQGADDDVYDYWPSSFENCFQIAKDLDTIRPEGNLELGVVQPMYDIMVKFRGPVSEFEDPWNREGVPHYSEPKYDDWTYDDDKLQYMLKQFVEGVSK